MKLIFLLFCLAAICVYADAARRHAKMDNSNRVNRNARDKQSRELNGILRLIRAHQGDHYLDTSNIQYVRDDGRCGYLFPNYWKPGQCLKGGRYHCCGADGRCGNDHQRCYCTATQTGTGLCMNYGAPNCKMPGQPCNSQAGQKEGQDIQCCTGWCNPKCQGSICVAHDYCE